MAVVTVEIPESVVAEVPIFVVNPEIEPAALALELGSEDETAEADKSRVVCGVNIVRQATLCAGVINVITVEIQHGFVDVTVSKTTQQTFNQASDCTDHITSVGNVIIFSETIADLPAEGKVIIDTINQDVQRHGDKINKNNTSECNIILHQEGTIMQIDLTTNATDSWTQNTDDEPQRIGQNSKVISVWSFIKGENPGDRGLVIEH
ncbi:hypothetical protein WICPIJ_006839 [Wickerhamomyces pijperi]|uniref:Uncharacterized protein n=1 Tax=Wickerhamomyces pijperi TaxID=599730 RepID=A0A9P8Q110_WICPI|nr:hypothetical protein WICPIJ_006839 [Wickerhamomyces pijperi]